MKVTVAIGTRPEAIKLAPVIRELRSRAQVAVRVVATAQHRELLDQALSVFDIAPDADLAVMQPSQTLAQLTGRVLTSIEAELRADRPDVLVVQGDTTTVVASSLAAFYERIPVAHVEAGLRSHDPYNPFPEEANRRLTAVITRWHFAPTARARENLLSEGVPDAHVFVTGNTVVDALHAVVATERFRATRLPDQLAAHERLILVTLHRRESWGEPLVEMCAAIRDLCRRYPESCVFFPVHLNPNVRVSVAALLGDVPQVRLLAPLEYVTFLKVMQASTLILTDSGGVQEEAPVFGRPVLVLRDTTERPEAVEAGVAIRVGTSRDAIVLAASRLLDDRAAYDAMARATSPFGDGSAARRIADVLTAPESFH
jgi:UDP-N-acetylglucosamine 2-epimerase (non-hydrolysing)